MKWQFEAIGTGWRIETAPFASEKAQMRCRAAVTARIEAFDKAYSRFRADSLVSRMAKAPGAYDLPDDAAPMLALYRRLYELTDGAMSPLIGQVLADAGYDAQYSLKPGRLTAPPAWDEALEWDGAGGLVLRRPVLLDVGAAGKGYLVDLVAEVLQQHGVREYLVDAGGDLRARGRTLRVGLENPRAADEAIGVATISDRSLCGSAGNRRTWGEFHHVIDPHSLTSPRRVQAVWVVADTTMLADALTTALFFVSPHRLRDEFDFEYLIVDRRDEAEMSSGFPGELFTA